MVGIMWDLGTFWPRDAHPLAPPCYAERAVPEIAKRVTWLARTKPAAGVVPTGHSQGSVLLAATVRQLPADVRTRLALLTYGSPLTRLYGKYFPTYFGPTELELVAGDLALPEAGPRWINLYYDTDPIGAQYCRPPWTMDHSFPRRPSITCPVTRSTHLSGVTRTTRRRRSSVTRFITSRPR